MKLGFIGFGNMAEAICKGIIKNNLYQAGQIAFFDQSTEKRQQVQTELGIHALESNQEVWNQSETVILAVKPQILEQVLEDLDRTSQPLAISIAAGINSTFYENYLKKETYLRTMPNLNAQVGEAMTAIVKNDSVSEEHMSLAVEIFESTGKTVILSEKDIDVFTAIAGSSPALAFMFIDMLSRAAVRYGMNKQTAVNIAAQAVLGSAKTVLESHESPWNLVDQVSSPGGVTTEGILSLLEEDFSGSIIRSVDKMVEKNKEIGK